MRASNFGRVDCLQDKSSARTPRKPASSVVKTACLFPVNYQWTYANHIENTFCDTVLLLSALISGVA
jgi:hypothetical protein